MSASLIGRLESSAVGLSAVAAIGLTVPSSLPARADEVIE
jgi:hypothetical protein